MSERRNGTTKAHRVVRFIAKNVDYNLDDNPQLKNPFLPEDSQASAQVWENFKKLTIQHCKGRLKVEFFKIFKSVLEMLDQLDDPKYTQSIRNGNFDVGIS